jgi:ABC-type lipoprotein export system ATPase subunit
LEVSNIEDTLEIEYEVEHGRNKGLNELSVGGKGTVILSLALVEGDSPLVIDQPEEPLDTLAIHEQIVGTLRKQKDSRQFIFTTHNPNIAVGGDAELNYILEASADQGKVKSSGGVDHVETNKLLLHHLEGGIVAFELRRRKYIR